MTDREFLECFEGSEDCWQCPFNEAGNHGIICGLECMDRKGGREHGNTSNNQ